MSNSDSNNFEYSLSEIEEQLKSLGITDISKTGLANFQRDLQKLVQDDSQLMTSSRPRTASNQSSGSEITLTQNFNLDDISDGISLSENGDSNENNLNNLLHGNNDPLNDDNDDAISILSTTNMSINSTTASQKARKRKTIRNGVTTVTNKFRLDDMDTLDTTLNTTISDYLEPELYGHYNPGRDAYGQKTTYKNRQRSHSDQQKKSSSKSKSSQSQRYKSRSKTTGPSTKDSHSHRVNFKSYDDTHSYTESKTEERNRQSLYDEKIDDFVKALLDGDETVLENESVLSDLSRTNDELNLAAGLNKAKKSTSKSSSNNARHGSGRFSDPLYAEIDVEQLPPPPSFMRPSTAPAAGRRVNWHDPVKRFAEYSKYWNNQPKCNDKRDHQRTTKIKWQVRNELADLVRENDQRLLRAKEEMGDYGGYQPRKTDFLPVNHDSNHQITTLKHKSGKNKTDYVIPTEKKRHDIRWQIRNILHESGTA